MKLKERHAWQAAVAIHQQLQEQAATQRRFELPAEAWRRCQQQFHRLGLAQQRRWLLATERVQSDTRRSLEALSGELLAVIGSLAPQPTDLRMTPLRDIFADLIALDEEFQEVTFDRHAETIAVITEPIQLEGVYLGPFKIQVDWSKLPAGYPYDFRVVALDANPAASDDSVTHPHVQGESLCEGDARQPIRQALEQGRLLDFFVVVATVLRTYNAEGPYVSLSDWEGVACSDCGSSCSDSDRWTCEKCDALICGDCYNSCPSCDGIYCCECVARCEGCEQHHCAGCMDRCSGCQTNLCKGCLHDQEKCSTCREPAPAADNAQQDLAAVGEPRDSARALPAI